MLKKSLIYLSCFALLACFASCNKTEDGVYNPSKKIHKIYEVNENGEATLSQDWHWDGDMLTSIDNYYALLTLTDHFTYDDQSRLTRIDNGSSHSEFFYDGKELRTVIVYQDGDQVGRYNFEYQGKKISVIKMEIDDDIFDIFKNKGWSSNPLQFLLPEVSQTLQPVVKQYAQDSKGSVNITMTLHWDGHNVKTLDIDMDGLFGMKAIATTECTFDNKHNPFKGFFSLMSSGSNPMETAFYNQNNLLTSTTRIASMINSQQEISYEYEGNYPVKVVTKTTYGSSLLGDEEVEIATKMYEYEQ
ncbi:MAG: hypothetical protein IKR77_05945 [Bacteroidales bacterium]|nr:hypothetical protein [Bacteroidales bacterium]